MRSPTRHRRCRGPLIRCCVTSPTHHRRSRGQEIPCVGATSEKCSSRVCSLFHGDGAWGCGRMTSQVQFLGLLPAGPWDGAPFQPLSCCPLGLSSLTEWPGCLVIRPLIRTDLSLTAPPVKELPAQCSPESCPCPRKARPSDRLGLAQGCVPSVWVGTLKNL